MLKQTPEKRIRAEVKTPLESLILRSFVVVLNGNLHLVVWCTFDKLLL